MNEIKSINPLKRAILDILTNAQTPIKEYELHGLIGGKAFEDFTLDCSNDLRLFRQHFMVMNALYDLHHELLSQNIFLHISALNISLKIIGNESQQTNTQKSVAELDNIEAFNKLSSYYLNWDNFNRTKDKEVTQLLNDFWKDYLIHNDRASSLKCLQLKPDSNWNKIKHRYKQLCQQHHPDKGGDKLYFLQIRQAYDNLKLIMNQ